MGIYGAGAAGSVVGDALDRKERCGPKATIENNAAAEDAPKKKKISLRGLLGH
jgi:hypothetical protein